MAAEAVQVQVQADGPLKRVKLLNVLDHSDIHIENKFQCPLKTGFSVTVMGQRFFLHLP